MRLNAVYFAAAALCLALAVPAKAAPPPSGGYLETCSDVSFDGRVLTATCRKRSGDTLTTTIDTSACARVTDVSNDNGRMVCVGRNGTRIIGEENRPDRSPPRDFNRNNPPGGSYLQTCQDVKASGGVVTATCARPNGRDITTTLNFALCADTDTVYNNYGRLTCKGRRGELVVGEELRRRDEPDYRVGPGPRVGPPEPRVDPRPEPDDNRYRNNVRPPRGSYLRDCRVLSFDGNVLTAQCRRPNAPGTRTTLDIRDCDDGADITVERGQLTCGF